MRDRSSPPRRFTGWHMAAILIAFFGVVIAVNMLMATMAIRSFGGTVVDNSYVASQKFNGWLEQARAQDRLGWKDDIALTKERHIRIALTGAADEPLTGSRIEALAQHPLGRAPDIALTFHGAEGLYLSEQTLPSGRWQIRFDIRHAGAQRHLLREID
ncbi:FixH family protein [Sphingobium cloacae]|uniref:Integral membrane protein linked to a cation pump n=1 Tax=Sphingobium cloacae TaxID=120107 RepID=A0A1E1EZA2_9SPHN|nr:FixH family protein [Sphingobium cloacae]BAV63584.1 integral membrane protein linked to a cation pump [Sphingobium cloacae]